MSEMAPFIALVIMRQADVSLEAGQAKYRAYFITTTKYAQFQEDTNTILQTTESTKYPNGYDECIVTE